MPRNERISFLRNSRNPNRGSRETLSYYRQLLQVTLVVFWPQLVVLPQLVEILTRLILGEEERKDLLLPDDVLKDCL